MDGELDVVKLLGFLIAAAALILNVLTFAWNRFVEGKKQSDAITGILHDIDAIERDFYEQKERFERDIEHLRKELTERLINIEGLANKVPGMVDKVDLFWRFVQETFPKMLIHHDEKTRDELLVKLSNGTIKHDEGIDLKAILESEWEHMSDSERKSTEAMLNAMTRLVLEKVLKDGN